MYSSRCLKETVESLLLRFYGCMLPLYCCFSMHNMTPKLLRVLHTDLGCPPYEPSEPIAPQTCCEVVSGVLIFVYLSMIYPLFLMIYIFPFLSSLDAFWSRLSCCGQPTQHLGHFCVYMCKPLCFLQIWGYVGVRSTGPGLSHKTKSPKEVFLLSSWVTFSALRKTQTQGSKHLSAAYETYIILILHDLTISYPMAFDKQ